VQPYHYANHYTITAANADRYGHAPNRNTDNNSHHNASNSPFGDYPDPLD
jgi:hypothetical protein